MFVDFGMVDNFPPSKTAVKQKQKDKSYQYSYNIGEPSDNL